MKRSHPVSPQKLQRVRAAYDRFECMTGHQGTPDEVRAYNRKIKARAEYAARDHASRQLIFCFLSLTGWSAGDLARYLGRNTRSMRRLCSRNAPPDEIIDIPLKKLYDDLREGRLKSKKRHGELVDSWEISPKELDEMCRKAVGDGPDKEKLKRHLLGYGSLSV